MPEGTPSPRARTASALLILAPHAVVAVVMLNRLPRGFPVHHVRFYSNEAVPVVLLATCAACGAALARGRASAIAVFPGLWLGVAIGARVTFPFTGGTVASVALVAALAIGAVWATLAYRVRPSPAASLLCGCLGLGMGFSLSRAQRAPPPTTHPRPLSAFTQGSDAVELPLHVTFDEPGASVRFQRERLDLFLSPLLEFESRSPDRFWTVFSRWPSERADALDPSVRRVRVAPRGDNELLVHATRLLSEEVFSHLNSFTTFTLRGHRKLAVLFSPCPESAIEFVHADYPAGAPARFAYLDGASVFHVVEASSAEKGPFTSLARGRLRRGDSLSIRLLELEPARQELFELTFEDWSEQLSTELSPTAGFGVPQNSIQFGLASKSDASQGYVILNLAATSIGRGWDTVGHARGRYENRVTVRILADSHEPSSAH